MIVIAMQNVNDPLHGELTRYLLEIKAGVFKGKKKMMTTRKNFLLKKTIRI